MAAPPNPKPPEMGYPAAGESSSVPADRPPPDPSAAAVPNPAPMGVAYPYPYPPPPQYSYPNHADPNSYAYPYHYPGGPVYNPPAALFLRRLLVAFIAFFIAVGAIGLIIYIILRPQIPMFSVSSAAVSDLNWTSSSISGRFDITFSVDNINKKLAAKYWEVIVPVSYGGHTVGQTSLPPFSQEKQEVTMLNATVVASGVYVGDGAVKELDDEKKKGNGAVSLQVGLYALVAFNSGAWQMRRHVLRVLCEDVPVLFANGTANAGNLSGGPKNCWVSI